MWCTLLGLVAAPTALSWVGLEIRPDAVLRKFTADLSALVLSSE